MREAQSELVKLITLLLLVGMLGLNGWPSEAKPKPFSQELVKRAEAGDSFAQWSLGRCYYKGIGVTQDYKEAVKWYTKAAEQGYALAQSNLGVCYEEGTGVDKDEKEAVKWFTKSAEQGNELAKKALEKFKPH